jgi:hypothetical protein
MKNNKRLIANIVELVVGVILSACGYAGIIDAYWSGMGTALVIVAGLMLVRQIRYKTSTSYKEEVDVNVNDERNKYLRMKAWSWAGYLFVMICGVGVIVFQIAGLRMLSLVCSYSVCLIMLLYWLSYVYLNKKY